MPQAHIVDLNRTFPGEDMVAVLATDSFVRAASNVDVVRGIVRIIDLGVLCGHCMATIGAYPPEPIRSADRISGFGRWVHLFPIYKNHDGEPYYKPQVNAPKRAHSAWHQPPDTPAHLVAKLVKTLNDNDIPAVATIVHFTRFRVKCHECGKINTVEVAA